MQYIYLISFIIVSVLHLIASAKKDKKFRAYTKGFILIFLLLWYLSVTSYPETTVILAIAFSWLGDVLLIPHGRKWFVAGGISFMASHLMFILTYAKDVKFTAIPVWAIVIIALVYITASVVVFKGLKKYLPKALFISMFFYLLLNGTMNCFAFFRFLTLQNIVGIITFVGATQFFISDSTLFYVRFSKEDGNHFWVMLTYILSEFLMVLGLSGLI